MQQNWIALLFQVVFWIVAMTFVMRYLARSRLRARPPSSADQIAQPPGILFIGLFATVLFSGAAIASQVWPDESGATWPIFMFLGFIALGLSQVAEYFFARHQVDDTGMQYGRMLGGRGSFQWAEVERVGYNRPMNWYRIELAGGVSVRISGTAMGLPAFGAYVLRHVPAERIAPSVRDMLASAANGKLHKLWF